MTAPAGFEWLDLRGAIEDDPASLDFVLPGLLAGTVGAIVSAGGAGKTMAALELAALVAGGHDVLGVVPRGTALPTGRVLYISAEDPPVVLAHRMHAIGARLPAGARDAVYERLSVAPLVGTGVDVNDPSWWGWLTRESADARLVILDTLRRVHRHDENDGGAMATLLARFESLCRTTGTTVLFLHHASKAGALAGGEAQQASRGSSVLTDNVRWQANLFHLSIEDAKKMKVDDAERRRRVCFSVAKQNYGPPVGEVWLRREAGGVLAPVPLGAADIAAEMAVAAYARASQPRNVEVCDVVSY